MATEYDGDQNVAVIIIVVIVIHLLIINIMIINRCMNISLL